MRNIFRARDVNRLPYAMAVLFVGISAAFEIKRGIGAA